MCLVRRLAEMRTIPNGVDVRAFTPSGPVADRGVCPLLVVVGRYSLQKGQDLAIAALELLERQDARLRLVGIDADSESELLSIAHTRGVAGRLEILGVTDPRPHLRAADVVLVPSRWDGLSLALLEAMSCGAADRCNGGQWRGSASDAGLLVPIGDVRGLADAIDRALRSTDLRQRMGGLARERVTQSSISSTHTPATSNSGVASRWAVAAAARHESESGTQWRSAELMAHWGPRSEARGDSPEVGTCSQRRGWSLQPRVSRCDEARACRL